MIDAVGQEAILVMLGAQRPAHRCGAFSTTRAWPRSTPCGLRKSSPRWLPLVPRRHASIAAIPLRVTTLEQYAMKGPAHARVRRHQLFRMAAAERPGFDPGAARSGAGANLRRTDSRPRRGTHRRRGACARTGRRVRGCRGRSIPTELAARAQRDAAARHRGARRVGGAATISIRAATRGLRVYEYRVLNQPLRSAFERYAAGWFASRWTSTR